MMLRPAIKKGNALDDVIARYNPTVPEESWAAISASGSMALALSQYEQIISRLPNSHYGFSYNGRNLWTHIRQHTTVELSPQEINAVLQATKLYDQHENYGLTMGYFVSHLLSLSYKAGYREFLLDLSPLPLLEGMGYRLKGTAKCPFKITVLGDVGKAGFYHTSHLRVSVQGNVDYNFARNAKFSQFHVFGNAYSTCGNGLQHSSLRVDHNVKNYFGCHSSHSEFFVGGDCGKYWSNYVQSCTFQFEGSIVAHRRKRMTTKFDTISIPRGVPVGCQFKSTNEKTIRAFESLNMYGNQSLLIVLSGVEPAERGEKA